MNPIKPKVDRPIPKNAKKVFKGVVFDVYQWKQKMFDGSTRIFEGLKRKDSACVIGVTDKKKILILEQQHPGRRSFIGFPGGQIEKGEKPIDCARREFLEETGYSANKMEFWFSVRPYAKIDNTLFLFIAKELGINSNHNIDRAGERIIIKEIDLEELFELTKRDDFRDKEFTLKLFKIMQDKEEIEKFKKMLFE